MPCVCLLFGTLVPPVCCIYCMNVLSQPPPQIPSSSLMARPQRGYPAQHVLRRRELLCSLLGHRSLAYLYTDHMYVVLAQLADIRCDEGGANESHINSQLLGSTIRTTILEPLPLL